MTISKLILEMVVKWCPIWVSIIMSQNSQSVVCADDQT